MILLADSESSDQIARKHYPYMLEDMFLHGAA